MTRGNKQGGGYDKVHIVVYEQIASPTLRSFRMSRIER